MAIADGSWLRRGRAALLGVVVAAVFYVVAAPPHSVLSSDWTSFATGAHLVLTRPSHLYDHAAQRTVQAGLTGGGAFSQHGQRGLLPFWSPPWVALAAVPFVWAGDVTGGRLWMLAGLAALALGLYLLAGPRRRAVAIAALAGFPTVSMVLNGQLDGPLVLGLGAAWVLWREDRAVLAGAALTLTLVKPHLVIPLAAALLLGRRWRLLAGWAAGTAAAVAGAFLVDPSWIGQAALGAVPAGNNVGLAGLVSQGGTGPLWATYLLSLAGLVAVLALAGRAVGVERKAALLVAGGLLAAPHALATDLALVAPALLMVGDGGFAAWFGLSAGALAVALTGRPEAAALLSLLVIGGFMVRVGGGEDVFGRWALPSWWRGPRTGTAGALRDRA
ncbi:MAG: glycosyltransferase 87 family protein [Candidatus Dormibacterales bacterium]